MTGPIYATRVSPAGEVLASAAIPIATSANEEHSPLAVPTGQGALVAWWDDDPRNYGGENVTRLRATRVSPAGAALDTPALTLSTKAVPVEVKAAPGAVGSALFLLATSGEGQQSTVVRVSEQGVVSSPVPLPPLWSPAAQMTALGFDGTNHLLIWGGDDIDPAPYENHLTAVFAARFDASDTILDPGGIPVAETEGEAILALAAGSSGALSLIAWVEAGTDVARVRAVRVTPDGTVLDAQGLVLAEVSTAGGACPSENVYTLYSPAVTFDGARFVVAWQAREDPCTPAAYQVHGASVSPEGAVGAKFVISDAPGVTARPALASSGESETLVAYSHLLDGAPYGAERVRFKRVVPSDQPVCPGGTCACGDGPVDPGDPSDPGDPGDGPTGWECHAAGAPPGPSAPLLAAASGLLAALRLRRRRAAYRRSRG